MRDFKFDFETLFEFSSSDPYNSVLERERELFNKLESLRVELNFPAVLNDIGSLLAMFTRLKSPKVIFEMGSGYGHSAFWFLKGADSNLKKIILTEKRDDLEKVFHSLAWQNKDLMSYYQEDAFKVLEKYDEIDMALIDGVKADYLRFLEAISPKMKKGSIVFIDNSYWRGSFLDKEMLEKKSSARSIAKLHDFLKESKEWSSVFIPYKDGLSVLIKN